MAKTPSQIKQEIDGFLAGDGEKFWPGGSGGGGSRKTRPGKAVVRAHARTSPDCKLCSRLHTTEEHERHGGDAAVARVVGAEKRAKARKAKAKSGAKATTKKRTAAKKTVKKTAKTTTKKTAKKAKPKKATTKATNAKTKVASLRAMTTALASTPDVLAIVNEAVSAMPKSGRWSPGKVFISEVWRRVGKKVGMSLAEFKVWLIDQNRRRNLDLSRADLVGAMDPKQVDESEIRSLGSSFHFISDRARENEFY